MTFTLVPNKLFFLSLLFFLSPVSLFDSLKTQNTTVIPQSCTLGSMRPVAIVKRLLKGETPSIPLPPGIDDDLTSNPSTASWLLLSQSCTRKQSNPITSTPNYVGPAALLQSPPSMHYTLSGTTRWYTSPCAIFSKPRRLSLFMGACNPQSFTALRHHCLELPCLQLKRHSHLWNQRPSHFLPRLPSEKPLLYYSQRQTKMFGSWKSSISTPWYLLWDSILFPTPLRNSQLRIPTHWPHCR